MTSLHGTAHPIHKSMPSYQSCICVSFVWSTWSRGMCWTDIWASVPGDVLRALKYTGNIHKYSTLHGLGIEEVRTIDKEKIDRKWPASSGRQFCVVLKSLKLFGSETTFYLFIKITKPFMCTVHMAWQYKYTTMSVKVLTRINFVFHL